MEPIPGTVFLPEKPTPHAFLGYRSRWLFRVWVSGSTL